MFRTPYLLHSLGTKLNLQCRLSFHPSCEPSQPSHLAYPHFSVSAPDTQKQYLREIPRGHIWKGLRQVFTQSSLPSMKIPLFLSSAQLLPAGRCLFTYLKSMLDTPILCTDSGSPQPSLSSNSLNSCCLLAGDPPLTSPNPQEPSFLLWTRSLSSFLKPLTVFPSPSLFLTTTPDLKKHCFPGYPQTPCTPKIQRK